MIFQTSFTAEGKLAHEERREVERMWLKRKFLTREDNREVIDYH